MKHAAARSVSVGPLLSCLLAGCLLAGCTSAEEPLTPAGKVSSPVRSDFPNLLDAQGMPACFFDASVSFAFSDLGAWHGFRLPDPDEPQSLGGFGGPLLHSVYVWLGTSFIKLRLEDAAGRPLAFQLRDSHSRAGSRAALSSRSVCARSRSQADGLSSPAGMLSQRFGGVDVTARPSRGTEGPSRLGASGLAFLPGMLSQHLDAGDVTATLDLVFADDRTALIRLHLVALPDRPASVRVGWQGSVFAGIATLAARPDGGVAATLTHDRYGGNAHVVFPATASAQTTVAPSGLSWEARLVEPVSLAAGQLWETYVAVPFYTTPAERQERDAALPGLLAAAGKVFTDNEARWNGYLARVLPRDNRWASDPRYRDLAVKAVVTLLDNWRSAAGDQLHAGVWPNSAPLVGYHGFWAWDSWKHAVALAPFEPELAKDQIRAMFDYQNEAGMVPDTVTYDSAKIYWGCTKPPLAAWAVLAVYRETGDRAFLEEMLPLLVAYRRWRYAERDHDRNGLCEFGSTDGLYINGRNESGMDNAVRFDGARVVRNGPGAYSLDQESVDLNAYLYADQLFLAEIEDALGHSAEAAGLREEAATLATVVRARMFDEETGYFYDTRLADGSFVKVQGPEGWTPLWTGLASAEQAEAVARVILDPEKFATYLPFPTVAADDPHFDPEHGYWRGMVWLDQAWFGVEALRRYGYEAEAEELMRSLLERAEGALVPGGAFRENYNPLSGAGVRAKNFSWTAGHFLMWFCE